MIGGVFSVLYFSRFEFQYFQDFNRVAGVAQGKSFLELLDFVVVLSLMLMF